ncbi:MAG: glycosyltransferase [Bifidobacteriaceae bacterium]|jgi:glycosyltransferase involved in cell wall biosynthesis|nr:glycosyltransferase [Bifidobacteriaceae bacterium]
MLRGPRVTEPHVVMAVANPIAIDARVRKTARSVRAMGYRVTLIYNSGTKGEVEEGDLDGVRTIGIPVPYYLHNRGRELKKRRAARMDAHRACGFGYRTAEERRVRAAQLAARAARLRTDRVPVSLKAARLWHSARSRALTARAEATRKRRLAQLRRPGKWRLELPHMVDLEGIFMPWMVDLDPDLLHVHDLAQLPTGVHAKLRLAGRGKTVPLIYDAHEYIAGWMVQHEYVHTAYTSAEREAIKHVDGVVTVSEPIAEAMQTELGLPVRPTVVLNAPPLAPGGIVANTAGSVTAGPAREVGAKVSADADAGVSAAPGGPGTGDVHMNPPVGIVAGGPLSVREAAGVGPGVPLVVFSGTVSPSRNLNRAVAALEFLPEVHLAIVCVPNRDVPTAQSLQSIARSIGAEDRLHLLNPVDTEVIAQFLSSATLGLDSMDTVRVQHRYCLPNKLFDYLHAGLPVAVSSNPTEAEFVRSHGVGAVFDPNDPQDIARGIRDVLERRAVYAAKASASALLREYSWDTQAAKLADLYHSLLPAAPAPSSSSSSPPPV